MVTITGVSTKRDYNDWNPSGDTISYSEIEFYQSDKGPSVPGGFITFGDGSRFRKATVLNRSQLRWNRKGSESSRVLSTTFPFINRFVETGPGGYTGGNFDSGNWIFRLSDPMGIPNVRGAPSFPTGESNEAVTKALNKLADQKVNLGENLATLGQTVRLFYSPCKFLYEGLMHMRKDKQMAPFLTKSFQDLIRGGVDKAVAAKYLAYVYGFKPLMQDIYALTELGKLQASGPLLLNARASSSRQLSAPDQTYYNASTKRQEAWAKIQGVSKTNVSLWAQLDPTHKGIRTLNQLGLVNPVSLVWELVPYSFVVDWFVPVGPILQAYSAPAGLLFVDGSLSRRVSASWVSSNWSNTIFGDTPIVASKGTGEYQYEGYNRQHLTEFPRPGLWFDQDPFRLQRDGSDRKYKALAVSIMALPRS